MLTSSPWARWALLRSGVVLHCECGVPTGVLERDEVTDAGDGELLLPLPDDPVARDIAHAIMSNPADPLNARIRAAHANRRTIERHFSAGTGMSLGKWRRRARVLASVSRLADGDNVTNAAVTVGYSTPSSFVAAFRAELGTSPRDFMRNQ